MNKIPQQQWEDLKRTILIQIRLIDNQVPWSEKEPDWWLEMSRIESEIEKTIAV